MAANVINSAIDSNRDRTKWLDNILQANGATPLVKLNKIPQAMGIKANIYVKLEYMNVGGSIDDRAAQKMIENAEKNGLVEGGTVVSPAIGNMAVSLAVVCAVKGYFCVIVTPKKGSEAIADVLHTLGAKVIMEVNGQDVTEENYTVIATAEHVAVSGSVFIDPKHDSACISAHEETTGREISDALGGKVNKVVVPINVGSAASGISQFFKKHGNTTEVYGVEATVSGQTDVKVPELEFDNPVADLSALKAIEKVSPKDAFLMARKLIREEGVMCGASTGAAMVATLNLAKSSTENDNIVVIAADGIRNYMNHFVDDEWLRANGILDHVDSKKVPLKDEFDPKVLIYDPTTLAGEWNKDGDKHWTKCTYKFKEFRPSRPAILNNVLEAVGNTPLVKLQKLPKENGVRCNVFVKCEYLNAGGSTKDRIALRMIELAEAEGRLKPGMTIIEPTSGNTGIGLSLAAAVKGYKCIICMPVKMSKEKAIAMEALGSIIVRTPNEAAFDSAESHIGVALRLQSEIPGAIILDQYRNLGNPMAHYEQTAEEIYAALDGKIDYLVVAAGTGGSVTGLAKKLKDKIPNIKVVGVDPHGSILADPTQTWTDFYEVEGIGYDFVPGVLNRSIVDIWFKSSDKESFETARKLIREEGILCGGSSGTNVYSALQLAKHLPANANVVALLPDGIRNYLTKFLNDDWMKERKFL